MYDSPIEYVVEDPCFRDSAHSYFIQAVDAAGYLIHQGYAPNAYFKQKGPQGYYKRLRPICCTHANREHRLGFVQL